MRPLYSYVCRDAKKAMYGKVYRHAEDRVQWKARGVWIRWLDDFKDSIHYAR